MVYLKSTLRRTFTSSGTGELFLSRADQPNGEEVQLRKSGSPSPEQNHRKDLKAAGRLQKNQRSLFLKRRPRSPFPTLHKIEKTQVLPKRVPGRFSELTSDPRTRAEKVPGRFFSRVWGGFVIAWGGAADRGARSGAGALRFALVEHL